MLRTVLVFVSDSFTDPIGEGNPQFLRFVLKWKLAFFFLMAVSWQRALNKNVFLFFVSGTGIIKTIVNIDYEVGVPSVIYLVVRATAASVTGTETLTVTIADVDESPICTDNATGRTRL